MIPARLERDGVVFLEAPSLFFFFKKAGTVLILLKGVVTMRYLLRLWLRRIGSRTRFLMTSVAATSNGSMALFEGTKRRAVSIWDLQLFQVNSSARQILRSASKSTETLSKRGCAEKCVLIYNNIPGEFAPCRPASVVSSQFASYRRRSPDFYC